MQTIKDNDPIAVTATQSINTGDVEALRRILSENLRLRQPGSLDVAGGLDTRRDIMVSCLAERGAKSSKQSQAS